MYNNSLIENNKLNNLYKYKLFVLVHHNLNLLTETVSRNTSLISNKIIKFMQAQVNYTCASQIEPGIKTVSMSTLLTVVKYISKNK
jgi:hypothetical protein